MRLEDTKKAKHKVKSHQRPMGPPRRAKGKVTREGVFAVKARVKRDGEVVGPWTWWNGSGSKDSRDTRWWKRELVPLSQAKSVAATLREFEGAEVKVVTVWRKPKE